MIYIALLLELVMGRKVIGIAVKIFFSLSSQLLHQSLWSDAVMLALHCMQAEYIVSLFFWSLVCYICLSSSKLVLQQFRLIF